MTEKYWIDSYCIDPARNQISLNGQTETLPPKALAVLTYLAKHQGEVVSHDALMDEVWQGIVVSPNSLQRCITLLRKALGDDSKKQSVIKTHAKQGYSLEREVNWQAPTPDESQTPENKAAIQSKFQYAGIFSFILVILALSGLGLFYSPHSNNLTLTELTPLTASDEKEGNASYSPDGRYILFHRYVGMCENHLWAKDLTSKKEYRLTNASAWYGSHSFSPDGKQLIFLANQACEQHIKAKQCWNLVKLNWLDALNAPRDPQVVKRCDGPRYNKPYWLNDNSVAMLQKQQNDWVIARHSITSDQIASLYAPKKKSLYSMSYSAEQNLIAALGIAENGRHILDIIDDSGTVISTATIKRPTTLSQFEYIDPIFDNKRKRLIFSTKKKLFYLTYQGDIGEIPVPFYQNIYQVSFHPDGDKLIATYGTLDTDLSLLALDNKTQNPSAPSIARSVFRDRDGYFQPNGNQLAFISDRSGSHQLWIDDGTSPRQLSDFPLGTKIGGLSWSTNGNHLIIAADGQILRISLDGQQQPIAFESSVRKLFKTTVTDTLLLLTGEANNTRLVTYNLQTKQSEELAKANIYWAAMTGDGEVIYLDENLDYWHQKPTVTVKLAAIGGKDANRRFVLQNQTLYGFNKKRQLWSYQLNNGDYRALDTVDTDISYLTDIKAQQLLLTKTISTKKEIIELQ